MTQFGKREGGGRRKAQREAAPLIAVFTTITGSRRGTVLDLSSTGVRLQGSDLPRTGEPLEVSLEGIRTFGTVAWACNGQCGIAFESPLEASDVHVLRQRIATMAGLPPQLKAALEDWLTGFAR